VSCALFSNSKAPGSASQGLSVHCMLDSESDNPGHLSDEEFVGCRLLDGYMFGYQSWLVAIVFGFVNGVFGRST